MRAAAPPPQERTVLGSGLRGAPSKSERRAALELKREASTTCGRGAASGRRRPRRNAAAVAARLQPDDCRRALAYLAAFRCPARWCRYPPLFADMTGAARFPSGARPDASGGRLGRPASAGRPSTGARGVVPLPSSRQGGTPHVCLCLSFRGVLRGTGVLYMPGLLVSYWPLAAAFPGSRPRHTAYACCFCHYARSARRFASITAPPFSFGCLRALCRLTPRCAPSSTYW